jgi:hypothetical protein
VALVRQNQDGVLFRNQSREAVATIKLPLMPPGKMRVRSAMTSADLGVFGDQDWIRGVPIGLSDANSVEVLGVSPVNP